MKGSGRPSMATSWCAGAGEREEALELRQAAERRQRGSRTSGTWASIRPMVAAYSASTGAYPIGVHVLDRGRGGDKGDWRRWNTWVYVIYKPEGE